jgi:hypothetical protein
LSQGNASGYADLAVTPRFYTSSQIDARNGDAYEADVPLNYTAGTIYHFRMTVDIPAHIYSLYVTEAGGNEILVAENYSFRLGQETVESLDSWAVRAQSGSHQVFNFSVTPTDEMLIPSAPEGLRIVPTP